MKFTLVLLAVAGLAAAAPSAAPEAAVSMVDSTTIKYDLATLPRFEAVAIEARATEPENHLMERACAAGKFCDGGKCAIISCWKAGYTTACAVFHYKNEKC